MFLPGHQDGWGWGWGEKMTSSPADEGWAGGAQMRRGCANVQINMPPKSNVLLGGDDGWLMHLLHHRT